MVRTEDGIRVIRVPVPPLHNVGPVVKGLSETVLPLLVSAAGALLSAVDAVIVFSPPLKARFGCRIILNVQDLMPQAAVSLASDRGKAAEMGERGLEYCRSHFSRPVCIDRYVRLLEAP